MVTTYEDSQSLIKGQKQHSKETSLTSSIKLIPGFTKEETINCYRLNQLVKDMEWTVEQAATLLGIKEEHCEEVLNGQFPFNEYMQTALYMYTGIKLSTCKLDEQVRILWKARKIRFREVYDKYHDLIPDLKIKKTLFPVPIEDRIKVSMSKYKSKLLGRCLKCYRAAFGETQYSLADKVRLAYSMKYPWNLDYMPCQYRDYWHGVEIRNSLTKEGNVGFYMVYGKTVEQAIYPFLMYIKDKGIDPEKEPEKASELLDKLDLNLK